MRSIDVTRDPLIPLAEAARRFLPNPPGPTCLWRWSTKGVLARGDDGREARVSLETVRVGRARYTTAAAFRAFVERLNGGAAAPPDVEADDVVDRRLQAAGLLR